MFWRSLPRQVGKDYRACAGARGIGVKKDELSVSLTPEPLNEETDKQDMYQQNAPL